MQWFLSTSTSWGKWLAKSILMNLSRSKILIIFVQNLMCNMLTEMLLLVCNELIEVYIERESFDIGVALHTKT